MINYNELSDTQKTKILKKMYEAENKSFKDIADSLGTYANKIRRDAIKYKIKIRDKSDAQKNALKTGKHKHPTKGTTRNDNVKQKIGMSVLKSWESLSEEELLARKLKAKDNWDNLTDDEKMNMQNKANSAVRVASKTGSKLEKFIFEKLISNGFKVVFHQEQTLANTKLQIDLLIPSMNVAIEVDGPSHFLPVWGDDVLQKNKNYDNKKTGLILGKGLVLIRIKQTKDFSKSRAQVLYNELEQYLNSITKKFPSPDNRLIEIGD